MTKTKKIVAVLALVSAVAMVAGGCALPFGGMTHTSSAPAMQNGSGAFEGVSLAMPFAKEDMRAESEAPKQNDPTLPENQTGPDMIWEHTEYAYFGDTSEWKTVELSLQETDVEGNFTNGEELNISMKLPQCCHLESVLEYDGTPEFDGGFANGRLKFGEVASIYYVLKSGETLRDNAWLTVNTSDMDSEPDSRFSAEETMENKPGAYCKTDRYVRYIDEFVEGNNLLQYDMMLSDGVIGYVYFYVSQNAKAEDLTVYDSIVHSITVKAL